VCGALEKRSKKWGESARHERKNLREKEKKTSRTKPVQLQDKIDRQSQKVRKRHPHEKKDKREGGANDENNLEKRNQHQKKSGQWGGLLERNRAEINQPRLLKKRGILDGGDRKKAKTIS